MKKARGASKRVVGPESGARPSKAAVVGSRVRELRERRGWSQPDLAYRAGLHPSDLSMIENQRKDIVSARLVRLVVALDTSADYLLGLTTASARIR